MMDRYLGPNSSLVAKHWRPVEAVMAVEEDNRLNVLESEHIDSLLSTTGKAERWVKPFTIRSSPSSNVSKPTSGRVRISHQTVGRL